MKLVVLSDNFGAERRGGAERVAAMLADACIRRGHEVVVVTTSRDHNNELSRENGLTVYRLRSSYPERWAAYFGLYNPQVIGDLRALLRAIKPQLVHAHNVHHHLSYHSLKVGAEMGIPVVLTLHDTMAVDYGKFVQGIPMNDLSNHPKVDYRVRWLRTLQDQRFRYLPARSFLIRRYLHRFISVRVAVSHELRRLLEANGLHCTHVIHNGLDMESWPAGAQHVRAFRERLSLQGRKVVLFGGRLGFWKGGSKLIEAMLPVVREVPEALLLVAGREGPYTASMAGAARALGLREHLVFSGWLDGSDLAAAYHACNLVVVPSIYLDPFPTAVLEAMGAQKPVITTCFGGAKEAVVDGVTGYVVNPLNLRDLSQSIVALLEDEEKSRRMGEAGYQRLLERFNLEHCADQYLSIFRELVEGTAGRRDIR